MIAIRIFEITFPIYAIVVLGLFYGRKYKPDMTIPNRLNMEVFIPALLFIVAYERAGVDGLFSNFALAVCIVILLSGVFAYVVSKLLSIDPRSLCPPMMFVNSITIGLPLIVLSFGEVALSIAVISYIICVFMHITIGNYIINREPDILKLLLSPMMLAVALALILNLLEFDIANTILEPLRMLGKICVPLMLFALGVRLIDMKLSEWKIGMLSAVLAPVSGVAIVLLVMSFIELSRMEQGALFLFGVLPPSVMSYMFAEHYSQEPSKVAAMVLFGNAFSVISIPIALLYVLPKFG
jgi:malate permease and related proteins